MNFRLFLGVHEDLVDIGLNFKQVALRMESTRPRKLRLRANGPGPVTAGQIEVVDDMRIMNPDHVICNLDDGARIDIEVTVATGRGYAPARSNRESGAPIGLIPLDAVFSPRAPCCLYGGEHPRWAGHRLRQPIARSGDQQHDSPEEAVHRAAAILREQLALFIRSGVRPF